jgi:hypothetical protein
MLDRKKKSMDNVNGVKIRVMLARERESESRKWRHIIEFAWAKTWVWRANPSY